MDSILSGSLASFSGNPEVEKVRHRKRARDREETGAATAKGQKCHREARWMWKGKGQGATGSLLAVSLWKSCAILYNCQIEGAWYTLVLESSTYLACLWLYDLTCLSLSLLLWNGAIVSAL